MTASRRVVVALLAACALALAGCGSSSKKSSATSGGSTTSASTGGSSATTAAGGSSGAGAAGAITINNFAFVPPTVPVKAGATVTITNKDGIEHTVSADDGKSFSVNVPGTTATFTAPTKPGLYHFHCNIHQTMKGDLVVS